MNEVSLGPDYSALCCFSTAVAAGALLVALVVRAIFARKRKAKQVTQDAAPDSRVQKLDRSGD